MDHTVVVKGSICAQVDDLFHTLHTNSSIKYLERHLVLKYHNFFHRYIQEEMEFLDITSLGTTYRYTTKIKKKFKHKKRDFGYVNQKLGKGAPEP